MVLGVSVDKVQGDGVKSVRPFAQEFKISYPILMADDAVVDALDLDNIPTTLFFNRKGKLVARLEGRGKSGELAAAAKGLFQRVKSCARSSPLYGFAVVRGVRIMRNAG